MTEVKPTFNMNLRQAAEYLDMNTAKVTRLIAQGDIQANHVKGTVPTKSQWQIDFNSVTRYMKS